MKRFHEGIVARAALAGLLALPLTASAAWFSMVSASEQLTAVNSKQFNGYQRTRLPDGSYAPETFSFGDGGEVGTVTGEPRDIFNDATMDVGFNQLAHDLAGPLARENYISATDPAHTKFLVMVYWGRTDGGTNFGKVTDSLTADWVDFHNAKLLGYDKEADVLSHFEADTFIGETFQDQILRNLHSAIYSELEVDRYFVILRAYSFPDAWRAHKMKLLWETRFSLSQRQHDFTQDVTNMAMSAAPYFGQDSYGLVKQPLIREGRVEIGDVTLVDYLSPPSAAAGLAGTWRGTTKATAHIVLHVDAEGGATFSMRRGVKPARLLVKGSDVTVTVPGWDVLFEGSMRGDTLQGSVSEYQSRARVTLERER
ncbi:MAG TPA: hypothetical protein VGG34_15910 [Opitutaceae bacterium]|jgi:hypothetical protein